MLNLPIAMLNLLLIFTLLIQNPPAAISFPQPDATLRGQIQIQGRIDSQSFASAELSFTFDANASDPAAAWFPIQTFSQPQAESTLAAWDTTAVTDGDYALRLRVTLQDGSFQDALVHGLKIRNTTPLPTNTPTATEQSFNFQPINETPVIQNQTLPTSPILYPTKTALPANPAALNNTSIFTVFWQSAALVIVLFAFFSLLLRLRKNT